MELDKDWKQDVRTIPMTGGNYQTYSGTVEITITTVDPSGHRKSVTIYADSVSVDYEVDYFDIASFSGGSVRSFVNSHQYTIKARGA